MSEERETVPSQAGGVGDYLETLFAVVVEEARANPAFAARLAAELPIAADPADKQTPKAHTARQAGTGASERKPEARPQDSKIPDIHAVNLLRQHGAKMLRGRLSRVRTKAALQAIARRSGLRLTGKATQKSASRDELIDGIVAAAEQYVSQRESVAG